MDEDVFTNYSSLQLAEDLRKKYSSVTDSERKEASQRISSIMKSSAWFGYLYSIIGNKEIEGRCVLIRALQTVCRHPYGIKPEILGVLEEQLQQPRKGRKLLDQNHEFGSIAQRGFCNLQKLDPMFRICLQNIVL